MKKIIKFAVNNPITILMAVLGIMLLGKISYDKLSVDLLPDLNNPKLYVDITAGERPPEEIEKLFVKRMESMAIRQRDVLTVSSAVKAGMAQMTVEYTWNKDMDEAFLDLQKAMNTFAQDEKLTKLEITQNNPNTDPIILVGMSHDHITNMADLRKIFRNIHTYLATGGWLVFDLLRESEVSDSEPFESPWGENGRIWFRMTRPAPGRVHLTVRYYEDGVLSFEEVIRETLHDPAQILALLKEAGFAQVLCSDRLLEDSAPGTTWFVTARKGS